MYSNKQGIYLVIIKLSRVECCWSGGGGGDLLGGNLLGPDLEQPFVSVLATTVTTSHRVIEMPTTCKHRLCGGKDMDVPLHQHSPYSCPLSVLSCQISTIFCRNWMISKCDLPSSIFQFY